MQNQESIRAMLTNGASIHRIAARIIESQTKGHVMWRTSSALLLMGLYKGLSLRDAKAIIAEMSVDF